MFMRQPTPRWCVFMSLGQAAVLLPSVSGSPLRRPLRHCLVMGLSSFFVMFTQLPCHGV